MKDTQLEQFTLQKVKTKGQGLEVNFEVEETTGVEVYHDVKNVKSDKSPHPDLKEVLDVCRGYMAEIFYFSTLKELMHDEQFNATAEQKEKLEEKFSFLKGRITVTGVSISGKDENRGIIITGKLKTETGHETAINSQRIKFNGTKYGFEEDLEDLMTDLEGEVFEYVMNGKQAQLEMAFDDDAVDGKMAAAGENGGQQDLLDQAEEAMTAAATDEEE
ncbi:hypothetical protein B620_gp59 [Croceibacter phage P2559S]|uniref:hypothetical protein n=1 Tax=Croceibacter phage P2559S TaxID=1176422 RepID=UPI0002688ED6|nr:hypothetical protein B620_gp59 [Croceibacter phage P2559S]AFM54837.1 hypothetical protein P2559S_59 [Croceibacter phage P2559S]